MQKMSLFFPLLAVGLDVCAVRALHLAQLSFPLPVARPFAMLWAGGLVRAFLLALLTLACRAWSPAWALQSVGVLCFHRPVYASLLWGLGQCNLEELWGWHSWPRLLQGYVVTAVAWLYWSRYISPRLTKSRTGGPALDTGASLQRLMGFMLPYFWRFVGVLILVVISSYGEMAIPKFTGHMADWIMNEEEPDAFSQAIAVIALMTMVSAVLEFLCDLMYNITMGLIHTSVQGLVFESVLKQEIAFFSSNQTGTLVSGITTDTNDMSETLSEKLSLVMWYTARLGFLIYFMFSQSWMISLFTCMGLPILWVIPELSGHFSQTISAKVQESLAQANQVATETFSNMSTVRSFANEDGETERYRQRLEVTYDLNRQEAAAYAASTWANSISTLALKVCILYYGGTLVTRGAISSGDLVSFVLYELQFASAVEAVMHYYPEVKKAVGASEKIFYFLDRKPQVPPEGTLSPEHLRGHVEFKNVTFSYPEKTDQNNLVLKGVSLDLKPGQITALIGLNSSGKTTCVRLLERFYQPQGGEILLDGVPLGSYQDQYLHDKISVVSQECVLFSRSLRENIKYGCDHVSDEEMFRVTKLARAHKFITNFPNGYETDAGEKGGQLSGGQRQRITIARALIRRPKVLVLDNATSDLDTETEHEVYQALLGDSNKCTVLLISHKMSVVEKAHRIVVLKDGAVEEEGSHDELLRKGGFYAELVRKDNLGFHNEEGS